MDFLPKSEAAIARAGLMADRLAADLTLLHIKSDEQSPPVQEKDLEDAFARAKTRTEPPVSRAHRAAVVKVRVGDPASTILDAVWQSKARLLILGPHHKRPLRDALDGTILEKALVAGCFPVLVVRNEAKQPYRRVLIAVDLSESSLAAIRAAESLVLTPEAEAAVVHAERPPYEGMTPFAGVGFDPLASYVGEWKQEMSDSIRGLLKYESANFARYDIQIERQSAVAGIAHATSRYAPDLLVVGIRGGGRLRRMWARSVAKRVLHDTSCDVLIVPEGSFGVSQSKLLTEGRRPREPAWTLETSTARRRAATTSGTSNGEIPKN
jgi:nucleotide-binding universal stress UspA family protein